MAKETAARATCHHCHQGVAVKVNVAGKAYYQCDYCGFKAQHTWQKTSDAYMHQVAPPPTPEPAADKPASTTGTAPAKTPTPSKSPRNAGTVLG